MPHLSDMQRWQAIHEQMVTPPALLNTMFQDALGTLPARKQRIIAGESNEIYDVTTTDNRRVILRINHKQSQGFAREKWAIEACRQAGVPVPLIVGQGSMQHGDTELRYMVQQKLPGRTFLQLMESNELSAPQIADITYQAGQMLARIHHVSTSDFGPLNDAGHGAYKTIAEWFATICAKEEIFYTIAQNFGFSKQVIAAALQRLPHPKAALFKQPPHLIHNDFAPKHILVDQGHITGIIDFEFATSGYFGVDIPEWELRDTQRAPIEELYRGYRQQRPLPPEDEAGQKLCMVYEYFELLEYYGHTSPAPALAKVCYEAIARLIK